MGGISNIYSMWGRSLWLQEKYSKLLLFDSHAACYAASFRVSLYPQPRALSILLWQWNCDDEPCLQGAFPQGQPHVKKYTQHMRAHKHTVRVSSDHLFRHSTYLYIKNPWFGFSCFFWWLVACAELQITWIRVNTSSLFMQLFPPFLQRVKKYWVLYFSQVKWR